MINKTRKLLIRLGKVLPFVICFIVGINYTETTFAIFFEDLVSYGDCVIPNTRLSFFIGGIFEYNIQSLFVLAIISVSIRACVWNKLAILYLAFQLAEKSYFADIELYIEQIYPIAIANIIACICLVHKGTQIMTKKQMNK